MAVVLLTAIWQYVRAYYFTPTFLFIKFVLYYHLTLSGAVRYTNTKMDEERNPEDTREEMMFALSVGESVNGVKGPSAFMNVKHFNLVFGQWTICIVCSLV